MYFFTKITPFYLNWIHEILVPAQLVWAVAPPVENPVEQAVHGEPETQGERKVSAAQAVHVVPSPV